jgi:hypothetical protein
MNVLLLSMPDSFEHMPSAAIRMPNGVLTSLAGNVNPHHSADLILGPHPFPEKLYSKKLFHHCDISSPFVIRKAVNKHAAILLFENAVVK